MNIKNKTLVIATLFFITVSSSSQELPNDFVIDKSDFKIFDALLYKNKPDLIQYGILPLPDVARFWKDGESRDYLPRESRIKALAKKNLSTAKYGFINIEHWPLRGGQQDVHASMIKYKRVIEWVKEAVPNTQIGMYSMFPGRDYWRAIKAPTSKEYKDWQKENDEISILAHSNVDIIYPSLYTFYSDKAGWKKYAIANIKEARRYGTGKPIYVFLWPQYHNSNRLLRGKYMDEAYWKLQLETSYKYADGIVIWGGWTETWDERSPWWQVTQKFIRDIRNEKKSN